MEKKELEGKKVDRKISWDDVEILIIGAGTMGASLVQTYAQSGFSVGVVDVSDEILELALETIDKELESGYKAGIFTEAQILGIKKRILTTSIYEEACKGKNLKLAIETATEDIEIKKEIFRKLDELCPPHVVLASNSSSLDVNILANETKRPDKVVWMHYFYLPHKNRAGEYAGTDTASPESIAIAAKYMKLAGKVATPILSSRKGGAADVIFVSLLLEAARMIDEGHNIASIEDAGKKAFNMPMGFLELMDSTGIPLGFYTISSFSDSSNPEDPFYKAYDNFFTPPESYIKLMEEYERASDKSLVKWVSEQVAKEEAKDWLLVDMLKNRFLAVAFMTATEVVEAGMIEMNEVDKLCQNAFLWREGPFALMNNLGIREALRIVTERMELSHRKKINFSIPKLLITQAQKSKPWPQESSSVIFSLEDEDQVARIIISNPQTGNALDYQVFKDLKASFQRANQDERAKVIIFDSAPIKTFIAGVSVYPFIRQIKKKDFQALRNDIEIWQDVVFREMIGDGKPKIVIVDGAAYRGGVEVALAFASDPDSVVIITDRTSFTFPETGLGIYPVLRGTLTLPQLIHRATGDADLALALSRYYILEGRTNSSPRLIKYLGMADLLVQARRRDEVAEILAQAIIDNKGKPLSSPHIKSLKIKELPFELNSEEKEKLLWIKDLFSKSDFLQALYDYGRGETEISFGEERKIFSEETSRLITKNSPHAIDVANRLIDQGFAGYLKGETLDERARWELDNWLIPSFQHPDALEGLTALVEQRSPQFGKI